MICQQNCSFATWPLEVRMRLVESTKALVFVLLCCFHIYHCHVHAKSLSGAHMGELWTACTITPSQNEEACERLESNAHRLRVHYFWQENQKRRSSPGIESSENISIEQVEVSSIRYKTFLEQYVLPGHPLLIEHSSQEGFDALLKAMGDSAIGVRQQPCGKYCDELQALFPVMNDLFTRLAAQKVKLEGITNRWPALTHGTKILIICVRSRDTF